MWAILFTGKFETENKDQFIYELEQLAKKTETKIEGNFQFHQFIDFEEIVEPKIIEDRVEEKNSEISNISDNN